MITEVPSCILSQYLWCNKSIQVDNSSVYFLKFPKKKISVMFPKVLVPIYPLNSGMKLRENTTYMKVFIFNGYNQQALFHKDRKLCALFVIYTTKQLIRTFINVIVLNAYDLI